METKTVSIFSQKLAGYLMLKGFVLIDMRPDLCGSGRNVFFFNDSDELRRKIDTFKKYKK